MFYNILYKPFVLCKVTRDRHARGWKVLILGSRYKYLHASNVLQIIFFYMEVCISKTFCCSLAGKLLKMLASKTPGNVPTP
jgi:hypothetical protein